MRGSRTKSNDDRIFSEYPFKYVQIFVFKYINFLKNDISHHHLQQENAKINSMKHH